MKELVDFHRGRACVVCCLASTLPVPSGYSAVRITKVDRTTSMKRSS